MKKNARLLASLAMSLFLLTACASDRNHPEKQKMEAIRNLGEAYMSQGSHTMALREFLKAEDIYADDPYLQNDLGLAYKVKGSPEKAVEHFKKALRLDAKYSPARNNLGVTYMDMEKWEEAILCFTLVKEDLLYATPHFPLTNLGFVYYKLQNYDKALQYCREAIEIAPKFPMAHHNLGLVLMAKGRYAEAVAALETAVSLAPKEAPIYLDLAGAYQLAGEPNKAYHTYLKAGELAEDPKVKTAAEKGAGEVWGRE